MKALLLLLILLLPLSGTTYNDVITHFIKTMPRDGGYSVKEEAFLAFQRAIKREENTLSLTPKTAQPSFCSSATYLVFLETVNHLQRSKHIRLSTSELEALNYHKEKDGEGIWGRWNANGPGVAKLFHDLKCGVNFQDIEAAKKGDFMKIFWSEEIGKKEFGHLVIYLRHDADTVTFWSSNQPNGYGEKTVPREKVKWAIFSRLTNGKQLKNVDNLPASDPFLVDMLKRSFTREEVIKACAVL